MVQANLKVIISGLITLSNPFYGSVTRRKVIDETFIRENNHAITAPHGVHAEITISDKHFNIEISRTYLGCEDEDENTYAAYFHDNEVVYKLWVKFDGKGNIDQIILSEWLESGSFFDGDDADNVYQTANFTKYEILDF